jgi:hypothetical protein
MKRSPLLKLVLRKETVRALSGRELARAVGGGPNETNIVPQSGDKQCPIAVDWGG